MVNMALHIFNHFHLLTPLQEFVVKVLSLNRDKKSGTILSLILSVKVFNFWTIYLLVSGTSHSDNLQSEKRVNVICRHKDAVEYLRSDVKVSLLEKGMAVWKDFYRSLAFTRHH